MIVIENPEICYRVCNVCYEPAYREIYFYSNVNNQGISVALCRGCMKNLKDLLEAQLSVPSDNHKK